MAHKGKHSDQQKGKLKIVVDEWLRRNRWHYYADLDNGVFLVSIK